MPDTPGIDYPDPDAQASAASDPNRAQPPSGPPPTPDKPDQPDASGSNQPDTGVEYSPETETAISQFLKDQQQYSNDIKENAKEHQWAHQRMEKLMSQPLPPMPSFNQAYPQPSAPPVQKSMWGSLAAYAAIALPLAFALGRKGPAAWGAMQGFGEGLKALAQGNQERAAHSLAVWKAQNDQAIKLGEDRMNYYKDIMSRRNTDLTEKMHQLEYAADFWDDKQVADAAQEGIWQKIMKVLVDRDRNVTNLKHWRAEHEKSVLSTSGLDEVQKDYIWRMAQKNPDLRDGLLGTDKAKWQEAYDKGTKRYLWKDYLKERGEEEKASEEAKEEGRQQAKHKDYEQLKPGQPMDDDATKKMRDSIFGSDEEESPAGGD